jgi:amino acid permease
MAIAATCSFHVSFVLSAASHESQSALQITLFYVQVAPTVLALIWGPFVLGVASPRNPAADRQSLFCQRSVFLLAQR